MSTKIAIEPWGKVKDKEVSLYTLRNDKGVTVKITNYGGIITSWMVPDRAGKLGEIVMGFDNLDDYLADHPFFGALIGRFGNRIAKGKFKIGEISYTLATNNAPNHLHGGNKGFDKVVWEGKVENNTLVLTYLSKDGEEGYPGNLNVIVVYELTDNNELVINYSATTDKTTVVNLTSHSYFNLSSDYKRTILDHHLQLHAANYTPMDETNIPTGQIATVQGTPFDFTKGKPVGKDIEQVGLGYDHNFVLDNYNGKMRLVATLTHNDSGRVLETFSTEPGIQVYTANYVDGTLKGPGGTKFIKHGAICLETQHYPDSPNQSNFPSTLLQPGETYHTITKYKTLVN